MLFTKFRFMASDARLAVARDWREARRMRKYFRERWLWDNGHKPKNGMLPCWWCEFDTESEAQPIWLWCHNDCDWGNR